MKISLEREIALREKEELFFKNGIPKSETIDSLKAKLSEAKRLRNISLEAETGDFKALADFFKKAPRDEEFERIKHLSQTEKEKRKEAEILLAQTTHRTSEFSDFEAARAEIEALTEELNAFGGKRKRTFCWKPLLWLGAFTFLLGIGLSFVWTLLLILSGIGLGFIAFSLWARNASKKDSEMEKVACRVKKTLENKSVFQRFSIKTSYLLCQIFINCSGSLTTFTHCKNNSCSTKNNVSTSPNFCVASSLIFINCDMTFVVCVQTRSCSN
jgi:hypothetical protein